MTNLKEALNLAQWQSHKRVHAARITDVCKSALGDGVVLTLDNGKTLNVPANFCARGIPTPGDFYVQYDDGYESWSPAKAFEEGYTAVAQAPISGDDIEAAIVAKGLTAPRITPADIEAQIISEIFLAPVVRKIALEKQKVEAGKEADVKAALGVLTICILVLRNGYTIVGKSACASPANFDADVGKAIARKDAMQQIWALEGYHLRTKLAAEPRPPAPPIQHEGGPADAEPAR